MRLKILKLLKIGVFSLLFAENSFCGISFLREFIFAIWPKIRKNHKSTFPEKFSSYTVFEKPVSVDD